MIINFYKKITPTMRYRNRLIVFKNNYNKNKKYINTTLSKSGRNKTGKQTLYNKKFKIKVKTPIFNFIYLFKNRFFFLKWVNLDTKLKKKYNIFSTWNNIIFCLPNVFGSVIGSKYFLYNKFMVFFSLLTFGLPCFIKIIPNFYKICHIMDLKKNKPTYAVSSGCFSLKIPKKKKIN